MNLSPSVILTYHSLDSSGSAISLRPEIFEQQVRGIVDTGVPVAPLNEITMRNGAVALTFDDAFRNFREVAFPVLEELGLPATVFVVTGQCGKTNQWPSQPPGVPVLDLMSWNEMAELSRYGIDFGAHSVTHPDLRRMAPEAAREELTASQAELQSRLGRAVKTFAWPYGASNRALRRVAAERFTLACGTDLRFLKGGDDLTNLPRVDAYYLARMPWFKSFRSPVGRTYVSLRRVLRAGRAVITRDPVR